MPEIHAYEREPYQRNLSTEILRVGQQEDRPYAVLADTILFPEGGGQPADTGRLGATPVVDVRKHEGEIRHYLQEAVEPGPVEVEIDWRRRFDHMQQHTAQHLITAVALDQFGWKTTSFHLSEEVCDIELDAPSLSTEQITALEEAVAVAVRQAVSITTRRVEPEELADLPVRSRGLPADHTGTVRLVEIQGLDLNTCGGTHLTNTAELEAIKLLHTEPMRGGTRLYWVAGARARQRLGERETLLADLRRILTAPDDEIPAVVEGKLAQLKIEQRRVRHLESQLAESLAQTLVNEAAQTGFAERHLEDTSPSFLQATGRAFSHQSPQGLALLTASQEGQHFFLLAAGQNFSTDLKQAGNEVAEMLDGRGGGSAQIFQGKAGAMDRRTEAVAALLGRMSQ